MEFFLCKMIAFNARQIHILAKWSSNFGVAEFRDKPPRLVINISTRAAFSCDVTSALARSVKLTFAPMIFSISFFADFVALAQIYKKTSTLGDQVS